MQSNQSEIVGNMLSNLIWAMPYTRKEYMKNDYYKLRQIFLKEIAAPINTELLDNVFNYIIKNDRFLIRKEYLNNYFKSKTIKSKMKELRLEKRFYLPLFYLMSHNFTVEDSNIELEENSDLDSILTLFCSSLNGLIECIKNHYDLQGSFDSNGINISLLDYENQDKDLDNLFEALNRGAATVIYDMLKFDLG